VAGGAFQQPSALFGREPVAETDAEAPDALDAADARSEFRAQQASIGGLVRDPPDAANRRLMVAGAYCRCSR
jgi:hypothetical protein